MLKCASVYTHEIDDSEIALDEIKSQLGNKITILEHTIGIIMCHPEFISSGVVKYICKNLSFEVTGITTCAQAADGVADELILTIFVMTSDDIWFKTGITEGLEESLDVPIKTAVQEVSQAISDVPKLALVFLPCLMRYSGDAYVSTLQKIIPNVPVFGSIAIDDTLTSELSETIYNGKNYKTEMSFVLCYGNINPRFIVGTFPEGKVMPYRGEITKSSGSFVHEINNINAYKYFESIGFLDNGVIAESFRLVPFAIDQKKRADYDGIPVIRGIAFFEEDGSAVFRGDIDEGSTFSILSYETDDVLSATRQKIEQINNLSDINGVLLFPCIGRRIMTMRASPLAELEAVNNTIRQGIPFTIGYVDGEVSPTLVKNGIPTNRFHNYSLVILIV